MKRLFVGASQSHRVWMFASCVFGDIWMDFLCDELSQKMMTEANIERATETKNEKEGKKEKVSRNPLR